MHTKSKYTRSDESSLARDKTQLVIESHLSNITLDSSKSKNHIPKSSKSKSIKKQKDSQSSSQSISKLVKFKNFDTIKPAEPFTKHKSFLDIPATDITGREIERLGDVLKGKKLILIVNVASKCGLTKNNYVFMNKMYDKYREHGLEILAFPCNQFAS